MLPLALSSLMNSTLHTRLPTCVSPKWFSCHPLFLFQNCCPSFVLVTFHCRRLHRSISAVLEQACMWLHMGEQVSTLRKTCRRGGARGLFTVLYFICEASLCLRFRLPVQQNSGASFLKSFPWILNWYAAIPGHQQLSLNNWTPEEQARGKGLWEREKGRGQNSHGRKKGRSKQGCKGG